MVAESRKQTKRVLPAVLLVLLAAAALAAALYFLGGEDLLAGLFAEDGSPSTVVPVKPSPSEPTETPSPQPAAETDGLRLPTGMTEEYALRLWQEQVDSQANIKKLVDHEIRSFTFRPAEDYGDSAEVEFDAEFVDDSRAAGTFAMSRVGGKWFLQYVSGMREGGEGRLSETVAAGDGAEPETALPSVDEVDVELLNAVLDAQAASQHVFEDYIAGNVERIVVDDVRTGANTATIELTMHENGGTVSAEIVCLRAEFRGDTLWFLAGFERR